MVRLANSYLTNSTEKLTTKRKGKRGFNTKQNKDKGVRVCLQRMKREGSKEKEKRRGWGFKIGEGEESVRLDYANKRKGRK